MFESIVRIDLSDESRDFQPLALDLGLPMLDPGQSSYRIVRRWIGDFAAEPMASGGQVEFFAQREGRRQVGVECVPIKSGDLEGALKGQFEDLQARLKAARAETPSEGLVLGQLRIPDRQRDCSLFKYRTPKGPWQLAWCWGYQRKDNEPGVATICGRPGCSRLYVRRAGGPAKCPACSGTAAGEPKRGRGLLGLAAALALLGAVGGGLWFARHGNQARPQPEAPDRVAKAPPTVAGDLVVEPETWTGPAGGRIAFRVRKRGAGGELAEVGSHVVASAEDPRICRVDDATTSGTAMAPGRTAIHFRVGAASTTATVIVQVPGLPKSLAIEPGDPALNVGATARLRLIGEYADGSKVDLTGAARWGAEPKSRLFCYGGLVEGLEAGEAEVVAEYGAGADGSKAALSARRKVVVADEPYKSLELALPSDTLEQGQALEVGTTLVTASGRKVSGAMASALRLEVDPPQLADVRDGLLVGAGVGAGRLTARFRNLQATRDFTVTPRAGEPASGDEKRQIRMAVGEVADVPGSPVPDGWESRDSGVVTVSDSGRLIARAEGTATVVARAANGEKSVGPEVIVTVVARDLASLAIDPPRIIAPIDVPVPFRVLGHARDGRELEMAAESLEWELIPPGEAATLDPARLEILGLATTSDSAFQVAVRAGDVRAVGTVEVVPAPFRLSITPPGPFELPVGQGVVLQAWADVSGGRRVEVVGDRVEWEATPSDAFALAPSGLVTARAAGGGPWEVRARYRGQRSEPVVFRSTAASSGETVALTADRPVLLPGDLGHLRAEVPGPAGKVPFAPGSARFRSSRPEVLAVDPESGAYRAVAPGEAIVGITDPSLPTEVTTPLRVADPAKARLAFDPDKIALGVDQVAHLGLAVLVDRPGGEPDRHPLADLGDVRFAIDRPEAAKLSGADLVGLAPAPPFGLAATYRGLEARATVEVVAKQGEDGSALRFRPSEITAAPGANLDARLEQQVPGKPDEWLEVRPDAVAWKPDPALVITPGAADRAPQVALARSAKGTVEAVAKSGGKEARLRVTVDPKAAAAKPGATLIATREPTGEAIPVGTSQRLTLMVKEDGRLRPASGVEWPADFENEFVAWKAPTLTAKRAGHRQQLAARAEGLAITIVATTVAPRPGVLTQAGPSAARPRSVKIVPKDGKGPIRVTPGGRSDDYRVEATYDDGTTRDVTAQARVSGDGDAIALDRGGIRGLHAGTSRVRAEYLGVRATDGGEVEVVAEPKIDAIRVEPASSRLGVGETQRLRAFGSEAGQSVGEITDRADLVWKSRTPGVVSAQGPAVTAVGVGSGAITAQVGTVVGNVAEIAVVPAGSGPGRGLKVTPDAITLGVGESIRLGEDVRLTRGQAPLDDQCAVTVVHPDLVAFDPTRRALTGRSPGPAEVLLTQGNDRVTLAVRVVARPDGPRPGALLVIEPDRGLLPVGAAEELRVVLVDGDGGRVDRTASAVLESSAPAIAPTSGARVLARSPGEAVVTARLPGSDLVAKAEFSVVDPGRLDIRVGTDSISLYAGESRTLDVQGVGPSGAYPLRDHPDLTFTVAGKNPGSIAVLAGGEVKAWAPGEAEVIVQWRGKAGPKVAVRVAEPDRGRIAVTPSVATVPRGDRVAFRVTARQGDRDVVLGPDDGVTLEVEDGSIAQPDGFVSARGLAAGTTGIVIRRGEARAVARLDVIGPREEAVASSAPAAGGLRFEPRSIRLAEGLAGRSVSVLRTRPDGGEEDVSASATLTADPTGGVVAIVPGPGGPVIEPRKAGSARVHAELAGARDLWPLDVEVVAAPVGAGRVLALPPRMVLRVGEAATPDRVALQPGPALEPVGVPYRLAIEDARIAAVEAGTMVRGLAPGSTTAKVEAGGLATTIAIEVQPPRASGPGEAAELRLTGPSRTTAGASVRFEVSLIGKDGSVRPVTHDGARLSIVDGEGLGEVRPGGELKAKTAGTATLTASYRDLVSNASRLEIRPVAGSFRSLDLEIDGRSLAVGESRAYRVWGTPGDGGPRQDLTGLAEGPGGPSIQIEPIEPATGPVAASLSARQVVGVRPGKIRLSARLADGPRSEGTTLQVGDLGGGGRLAIEPARGTVRIGESTSLAVTLRSPDGVGRSVVGRWESLDPGILAASGDGGSFTGVAVGRARVRASVGDQSAEAEVEVLGNPFASVRTTGVVAKGEEIEATVEVRTPRGGGSFAYRLAAEGAGESAWTPAESVGDTLTARLVSPKLAMKPGGAYRLTLEARDATKMTIERYPIQFRVGLSVIDEPRPAK